MPDQEIEFDNNMREIGFYAIESGDIIHAKWWLQVLHQLSQFLY